MEIKRCYHCHELFFKKGNCPKCGKEDSLSVSFESAMELIYKTLLDRLLKENQESNYLFPVVEDQVLRICIKSVEAMYERDKFFSKKLIVCLNCGKGRDERLGFYEYYDEGEFGYCCDRCGNPILTETKLGQYAHYLISMLMNPDKLFEKDYIIHVKELNIIFFDLLNEEERRKNSVVS